MRIRTLKPFSGVLLLAVLLAGLSGSAQAQYTLTLNFMVDDPVMFPLGRIIPANMTNLNQIEFKDINPFFTLRTDGLDNQEEVRLHVQFETEGEAIFTISSELFPISVILGRTLSNYDLARIPEIRLGEDAGESVARRIMSKISGGWLQEGIYTIRVILSPHESWNAALTDNLGAGQTSFFSQNVSQITPLSPSEKQTVQNYPSFQWSYPRRRGVNFHLIVIPGSVEMDASEGFDAYKPEDAVVDVHIPVRVGQEGGDVTYYAYSGVYPEKALEPNQVYFWKVTAAVATMFENDSTIVESPEQTFFYQPPGQYGGSGGGSTQGQPGGGSSGSAPDLGLTGGSGGIAGGPSGGPTPEGESPQQQLDQIFILLGNVLPSDMYQALISQLQDPTNYTTRKIYLDNTQISLDDLALFLVTQSPSFVSMTISN